MYSLPTTLRFLYEPLAHIMKILLYLIFFLPTIMLSQTDERYWNREIIDSVHSKRLCTCYPGLTRIMSTKEAFEESKIIFTGKVIEIIRVETLDNPSAIDSLPPPVSENQELINIPSDYIEPIQHYWYVLQTEEVFKGEKKDSYKVYSRIYSTISPLLMLNKKYLIYAIEGEIQEYPYFYCNGNSCHIEHAEKQIKELRILTEK